MGVLKFKNPKVREGLNVSTIEAMRARGYDIYVCAKGKDVFINSSAWDEEKAKKLFDEYGLKTFRETSGDENLVIYDPNYYECKRSNKTDSSGRVNIVGTSTSLNSREPFGNDEGELHYCGPLEGEVELPINCSSLQSMFFNITGITCVDFSSCDLKDISCFNKMMVCTEIKEIYFGKQNLSKVISISNLFRSCCRLEHVEMREVSLPNIQYLMGVFDYCTRLQSVDIGQIKMPNLKCIDKLFNDCIKLREFNAPNWDCSIEQAYSAFANCTNLESVDMRNVSFIDIASNSDLFHHDSNLINFQFKDFSVIQKTEDSNFGGCVKMIAKFDTDDTSKIISRLKNKGTESRANITLLTAQSFNS